MSARHMPHAWALAAAVLLASAPARADRVIADDYIVQGSACVGVDCVNNMDFAGDLMRLRENNLRIRLHDTTAAAVAGQSWNIEANSNANGGANYVNIESKGLVVVSDGTAIRWDCSSGSPVANGTIPAGQPASDPETCGTLYTHPPEPVVQVATFGNDSIALGHGSAHETGAVSLGSVDVKHRLVNVAEGLAETDALILRVMQRYGPLRQWTDQVAEISAQLDAIEAALDQLEDSGGGGGGGDSNSNLFAADLYLLLGLAIALAVARRRFATAAHRPG